MLPPDYTWTSSSPFVLERFFHTPPLTGAQPAPPVGMFLDQLDRLSIFLFLHLHHHPLLKPIHQDPRVHKFRHHL